MSMSVATEALSMVPAYIVPLPTMAPMVSFQYNPDEITISHEAEIGHSPQPNTTSGVGAKEYKGQHPRTIRLKLILDLFSIPPIPPDVNIAILKQCMAPDPLNLWGDGAMRVVFGWGTNVVLPMAHIKSMSVTYKRFLLGQAVRAEVDLSLEEAFAPLPGTNPSSGGLAPLRTHMVIDGDTLASISHREYGSPAKWRILAEANRIDDPMRLRTGTDLFVPDLSDAESMA
jgi:hypothetical protein